MKKINNTSEFNDLKRKIEESKSNQKTTITISSGTCGLARGSNHIIKAFQEELKKQRIEDKVELKITGCHGFCEVEPNIVIFPDEIFYQKLEPKDVKEIISETILGHKIIDRLLYTDPQSNQKFIYKKEIPFYKKQKRLLLENNLFVDPTEIEDFLAVEGYTALNKVLTELSPEQVIEIIKKSGLRGRGGAGFPTGRKWEITRKAKIKEKYIICNADEGDPGAYMDRSLLEGNPHSVIEGMIIGAYAIGASKGYIYVRDEYPLAVENVTRAIQQAKEYGFLGENILGSNFDFDIEIYKGAGAFVCGEETALIGSIEGKRGVPRQRPPYPAQKGLFGKPTNINNVETWANVPLIINKGPEWYSKIGTNGSKGTKIFSLVGKINNTGLVEVPMGMTLREIIYEIGGGILGGKEFKAVQTGGPSGGCIPKELLDLPIDFESLTEAGSIMGSGGMIVMDENTCMVDVAKYFLNFLREESCGKCLSCREGTQRMWEIVRDISEGKGKEGDIELLEELAEAVKDASMCGLGQTAANPVLSTLRYFRDEYEAHIKEKKCPAGVCKDLIQYFILEDKCTGCLACIKVCPQEAISGELKKLHIIDQNKCIKCGACVEACRFDAIIIK
ncbi:NADH-quinone oxidoreductase subunit NuoF [Candidatus Aminicenantes bacterium AH-873-B07]|jgi:NADH-quinone oxidoreductase subunit F|nr:NADH-quinone oxidoreductase subunit NuoF [Candidatus Aminicenantes bacterium AH-873-B07]